MSEGTVLTKDLIQYLKNCDQSVYHTALIEQAIMTVFSQDSDLRDGGELLCDLLRRLEEIDKHVEG